MRFIVDEDMPRSTCALLREYGHIAFDVRDIGYRGAKDADIASYAQREGLCIVTGDSDFSDVRNYCHVVLALANLNQYGSRCIFY